MKTIVVISTIALALVAALTARAVSAQGYPEDKRVFFTFSGPVAVPGVTLPAGRYLFRVPGKIGSGNRRVVQVLSDDGKTSYAQFFSIRAERVDAAAKPELRFLETAEGMPAAVKTWWYPGDKSDGYEFIYPKEQARLLAKGTGQPVLTARATAPTEVERITPSGEAEGRAETPVRPEGPAVVGEIAPPAMPVIEPTLEARTNLPKTASATPLIAFMGLGLLLLAALVRGARVVLG